jgi:hypothetical protein
MMSKPSLRSRLKRRLSWAGFLLAVCILSACMVSRWLAAPTSATVIAPSSSVHANESETAGPDERFRRLAFGTWEDRYEGKRTMTLKEDGTGTMLVELSGLKAALFADRLRFDMTWAVENGHLKKRTIGGEPARKVQAILKMMGDRVDEPILELTRDHLLLLDKDGKTKYDWRRVWSLGHPSRRNRIER